MPLGTNQSRGDQIENARFFEKNGFAKVVTEEDLPTLSVAQINEFYDNIDTYKNSMKIYKEEKRVINDVNDFYNKILEKIGGVN